MTVKLLGLFAMMVLVAGVVLTKTAPAAPDAKAVPAAASRPAPAEATPAEPHPEIREAIGSLRRAKEHMEHAAHDFGGHRVDAIHATDDAIHQLEVCLRYDKD